jgi:hypothetical protein
MGFPSYDKFIEVMELRRRMRASALRVAHMTQNLGSAGGTQTSGGVASGLERETGGETRKLVCDATKTKRKPPPSQVKNPKAAKRSYRARGRTAGDPIVIM